MNLSVFNTANLFDAATGLFSQLGIPLSSNTTRPLPAKDLLKNHYKDNETFANIENVFFIGIIDDTLFHQTGMFDQNYSLNEALHQADKNYDGLMLFALELKSHPTRSEISDLTRAFNRISQKMPVALVLKYSGDNEAVISIAISERFKYKQNWRQGEKAGKVIILRDIHTQTTHTGHQRILLDLTKPAGITTYEQLHAWWLQALDVNLLNKKFYREVFDWYLWALKFVKFPQIRPETDMIGNDIHQSESMIRLLTRLLFCWFMKEKQLISGQLFSKTAASEILVTLTEDESTYYKAILQNLFFATLNKPVEERKVIHEGFNPSEYGDPLVYRYKELFKQPDNILACFQNIPFLNGGLFDCLDRKKDHENPVEIRLDGFSTKPSKQPVVPNKLFFGKYSNVDLSAEYDDRKKTSVDVRGIIDIFSSYKFTIEESTPVEEEVALDPELLGKVFENLLASYNPETKTTARKQTGSFYTPREIVNYMVDESLLEYLKGKLAGGEQHETALRSLIAYENTETLLDNGQKKQIIQAINDCRVLDPACGSGAFPMGVLQRMLHILKKIDPDNRVWLEMVISNFPDYLQNEMRQKLSVENWDYVRKLGIIQECIYGIDIQPIAIQISKLRFFISLLVDQKEKPGQPNRGFDPLPNLDFKLVAANTLIGPPQTDTVTTGLFADAEDEFETRFKKLTSQYFSTYKPDEKKSRKDEIERLINAKVNEKINQVKSLYHSADSRVQDALKTKRKTQIDLGENDIKLWKSYTNLFKHESVGFFDTHYFFPQIKEGFDIVIGNPPYVRPQKLNIEFKTKLWQHYKTFQKKADLYVCFIENSVNIVKNHGIICLIVSNGFLRLDSFEQLRKLILKSTKILTIVDFDDDIFETATVKTCILKLEKNILSDNNLIRTAILNSISQINSIKYKFIEQQKIHSNFQFIFDLSSNDTMDRIKSKIKFCSNSLETNFNISFGLKTGDDEKFLSFSKTSNQFKKLLRGEDIDKYTLKFQGEYVLFVPDEMRLHRKTARPGDAERYEQPKILVRDTGGGLRGTFDNEWYYVKDVLIIVHISKSSNLLKKLIGIINSSLMSFYYNTSFPTLHVQRNELASLPIHKSILEDSFLKEVPDIVDQILALKQQNPQADTSALENEIDQMVYKLYGLTEEEIGIVENKR